MTWPRPPPAGSPVGNDGGSFVSPGVGRADPDHIVGVHVTQLFSFPSGGPAKMADLNEEDMAALEHLQWFHENMGAFGQVHAQAPQMPAHALADSRPAFWRGTAGCSGRRWTRTSS